MRVLKFFTIAICFVLLASNNSFGQGKYNNNWITGGVKTYIINFDSINPKVKWYDTTHAFIFAGSHSSVSDSSGEIQFLTNGAKLYNKLGLIIENGDSLIDNKYFDYSNGTTPLSQGSVILLPFDSSLFKVFTGSISDSVWTAGNYTFDRLYMHVVDMKANAGLGKTIVKKQVVTNNKYYSRVGMTACRHANGKDWWLAKQGADSNIIYTFFVGKDSIAGPFAQGFTTPKYNDADRSGQLIFNQQGTKIANVQEQPNQLFLADFDRCSGQITNPKTFNIPALLIDSYYNYTQLETLPSGLCFSPNGQFLYVVMRSKIFQLDITEVDSVLAWVLLSSVDTLPAWFQYFSLAQLSPDNKIYIGKWGGLDVAWNVIDNPDVKGLGCNFCKRCLRFPKNGATSPPNCINYNLGASATPCWPLAISSLLVMNDDWNVALKNELINIQIAKTNQKKLSVFNGVGVLMAERILQNNTHYITINTSSWARGVYIVRLGAESKKVVVE
jgi:hypothetical protein